MEKGSENYTGIYIAKAWFLHAPWALITMALGHDIILLSHCNLEVISRKLAGYGEILMIYINHNRLTFQHFRLVACFASENSS